LRRLKVDILVGGVYGINIIIGSIASIVSVFISFFIAGKVIKIFTSNSVKGEGNVIAGRDAEVNK